MPLSWLVRPRPRTAHIAMAVAVSAAFAVFGVMLSLWLMTTFRPFGRTDAGNVVVLTQTTGGRVRDFITASNVVQISERSRSFAAVARVQFATMYLRMGGGLEPGYVALVSPEFLRLFEGEIIVGRSLLKSDEPWTDGPAGIVTEAYWKNHLGRAADVIGRQLRTADWSVPSLPVVGVLGKRFRGFGYFTNRPVDLILPLPVQQKEREGRNQMPGTALAVLAPGVTPNAARHEIDRICAELRKDRLMDANTTIQVQAASILFRAVQRRLTFAALTTAIAFLLVLVCAAGVLQVQAVDRMGEMAIRQALGAGYRQMVMLLVNENLRFFVFTACCGSLCAAGAIQWLGPVLADGVGLPPALDPRSVWWLPFGTVAMVPLFAALVTIAQMVMLAPALRPGKIAIRSRWTLGRAAMRRGLVVVQGVAATGLAFAAIAAVHGLLALEKHDLGFAPGEVLSARVALTQLPGDRPVRWERFYNSLRDEVKGLPGVRGVGIMRRQPGESSVPSVWTTVEPLGDAGPLIARGQGVHPSFFAEMGIAPLAGRVCDAATREEGSNEALVNEAMALQYWPKTSPVGAHLKVGRSSQLKIVGVVPSLRSSVLDTTPSPEVFDCTPYPKMYLMIRHSGQWAGLQGALAPVVHRINAEAAIDDIVPLDELLDRSLRPTKVLAGFLAGIGAMSVLVAALGLFAISSMMVAQRRTELAVRIAVGADPVALGRRLEGEGVLLGAAGIVGGWVLYRALVQYFASQGLELSMPWLNAAQGASLLLLCMWLAVKWPANSLRRIEIMAELRQE